MEPSITKIDCYSYKNASKQNISKERNKRRVKKKDTTKDKEKYIEKEKNKKYSTTRASLCYN